MGKKIVIVGGVAGGASCAARARRLSEEAEILLIERGPYVSFANCGLPYFVGGEIQERAKLLVASPELLKSRFAIDVRTNTECAAIDREKKEVTLRQTSSGEVSTERYDALVLATGATPFLPAIPGIDRRGHFAVRSLPDVDQIQEWIGSTDAKTAAIVGGGYIGLEMAEQLAKRGLSVSIAEALDQLLAPLDPEMAAYLQLELQRHDVAVHLNDAVRTFEDPAKGEQANASTVVLQSGKRVPADIVILGLGVRPETGLAVQAGLTLGKSGGIKVSSTMVTSDPNIFAVGDAVEVSDIVTGQALLVPLAGPANRQGRIAADNIFGREAHYHGSLGTAIVRVFDMTAGGTGANEKTLRRAQIEFEAVHLHPAAHAGYYPNAHPLAIKILYGKNDRRLLGAQVAGKEGVDKRIDVLATAILAQMTVDDLAELELAYAPPFGSAKDPVNLAGMAAQNAADGLAPLAQWHEVPEHEPRTFTLLDVREPMEYAAGHIDGSLHIPLGQLRQRLGEIPRDRPLIVHCQSGQRSYFAVRILRQHGFDARNLSGSYKTWKAARS